MNKSEKWINCIKGLAMVAVVVDHFPYRNGRFALLSFFSVTLFTLISGYNSFSAIKRRGYLSYNLKYMFANIWKTAKPYIIASLFLTFVYSGNFNLVDVATSILTFKMSGPYYFLCFLFQLLLINQFLYFIIKRGQESKHSIFFHSISLIFIFAISVFCIKYTYILPLHGGGAFLFGGTYLFVYYLGMLSCANNLVNISSKIIVPLGTMILCVCAFYVLKSQALFNILPMQLNPPGITLILYGFSIFIVFSKVFIWIDSEKSRVWSIILKPLELCGKYSMYIFLYHLVSWEFIKRYITDPLLTIPNIAGNNLLSILVRVISFAAILGAPIIGACIFQKTKVFIIDFFSLKTTTVSECSPASNIQVNSK